MLTERSKLSKKSNGELSIKDTLMTKIHNKSAYVAVFGLGRVGLPTAVAIASQGYRVIGYDTNKNITRCVSNGINHINEKELTDRIKKLLKGNLFTTTIHANNAVRESDIVMICIPTPVNEFRKPVFNHIESVCRIIHNNLNNNKLILLESTVAPNTVKGLVLPLLENGKWKCGEHFLLAYCPERMIPGRALTEFINNDRIVGVDDEQSASVALEFLRQVTKGKISVTDTISAEITKLVENTFRDVNIALANEIALICEKLGVDVEKIFKLANTHPRVNLHKAGPGVGGPCLPKDPYLLLSSKQQGAKSSIIAASRELNDYMPEHVAELSISEIERTGKSVKRSKVVVFGVAYKADIDDSRYSPSEKLIAVLKNICTEIRVFDPYCDESFGAIKFNTMQEAVKDADCIIIVTDHTIFKNLDLSKIKTLMAPNPIIIDGRRFLDQEEVENQGFIYKALGRGRIING